MQNPPGNRRSLTQEFNPDKPLGNPQGNTSMFFYKQKTRSVSCRAAPLSRRYPNPRDTNSQTHPPPHGSGCLLSKEQPCKLLRLKPGNTLFKPSHFIGSVSP